MSPRLPRSVGRPTAVPLLLLLALPWPVTAVAGQAPLAIVGVEVLPMDGRRVLHDQAVVVRGDRIVALGEAASVVVPDDATVVDGNGRWLLPGLIDSHVHLNETDAEEHLLLYLAHGVTTVQEMGGSPWHLEIREAVESGRTPGPRIVAAGPTTATAGVRTPEQARAYVAEQVAAGFDLIKMYGDGSSGMAADTYRALVEAAHEAGLRVAGHAPRNQPFSLVLETGQDSIDHLEEVLYTWQAADPVMGPLLDVQFGRAGPETAEAALAAVPDGFPATLGQEARALARDARAAGIVFTPTLVAFRTILDQTVDERYHELLEDPSLAWVHPAVRLEWGPELNGYRTGGWEDLLEVVSRILGLGYELQASLVRPLADAGVPLLAGTDASLELVVPGVSLHRELGLLRQAGLDPWETLEAATRAPAEAFGLGDEIGRVAPGLRADLLLVEGDPLEDLANLRRIAGVVTAGDWHPAAELEESLDAVAERYRQLETRMGPMIDAFLAGDAPSLAEVWRESGGADPEMAAFARRSINRLGYRALNDEGDPRQAVGTFRLATELFPEAANPWDSLGEGLLFAGELEGSLAAYRQALELDPGLDNARTHVEWIEPIRASLVAAPTVAATELDRYTGDYGPRHLRREGDSLVYWRGDGEPQPLVPLGDHRFMIEGVPYFLMRFELGDGDRAVRLVGSYADGREDVNERDEG